MKAWRIAAHGGLSALRLEQVHTPSPGSMEVRIRVEAVGLNHLDVWVRKGVPGHRFPLPITPGCDVSGVIDEFGPGAADALPSLKPGSPIIVNPGISCGHCQACLGGFDPLCASYGIFGETRDGGAAEYLVIPIANVIARPANLSAVDAASLPIPFLTAWTMLTRKAQLMPGETVLIQAGGSGVSVAAIQIAKFLGAEVFTTVGSAEKVAKARALGADHVIEYRKTPFREELKRLLAARGRKGVDVVVDHVGQETFLDSLKSLAWGGRLVCCGATGGAEVEKLDLKMVFFKNLSILGTTMGSKADLIRIVRLVSEGKLKPVVDSTFPFEDYSGAEAHLESRRAFGKVVVRF